MNRVLILICLLINSMMMVACSTFSREQCQKMDWSFEGYNRARDGDSAEPGIGYYKKECDQEHGIKVNEQLYNEGYQRGLNAFCTKEGGFSYARHGGHYRGTCPKEKESEFLSRFTEGRLIFLEDRLRDLEHENKGLRDDVDSLRSQLSSAQSELSSARGEASTCRAQVIR